MPEDAATAVAAIQKLANPDPRAAAFCSLSDKRKAAFVRGHVLPITRVLRTYTGIGELGWDLNKLEGIATGVQSYDNELKQRLASMRKNAVAEYRQLEEERLRRTAALSHYGRGASLSGMADIRHAECKEGVDEAKARGPLRAPRAAMALHKVWFCAEHVLAGFSAAVGLTVAAYLELPRATAVECEVADTFDKRKITYYGECLLQACNNAARS